MNFSDRINNIAESKTVQFTPLIQRLRQQGKPVVDFAVGEPEFKTAQPIIDYTRKALENGQTRYGPVPGLPELRSLIADQYQGYDLENIIVSNGSKQSLFLIFQVILNPLDEVIIPRPYWVSFAEQVKLAGGIPVFADTVQHQLDVELISRLITPKTRAVIINSPNNPTGTVYPEKDLKAVSSLAARHDLYVISDEAYGFFVYDGIRPKSLYDLTGDKDRLIVVAGFSKQYSMTGFRIGYAAADKTLVKALSKYQSHASGNVCTFAQHGALGALSMDKGLLMNQKAELEKKRDLGWSHVSRWSECIRPQGAFYLFPNISKLLKPNETDSDFAADLLNKAGVAVVPGEAFGAPGHIRISYAVPENLLVEGLEKIAEYMRLCR
jgi:aspartate aminotransferase